MSEPILNANNPITQNDKMTEQFRAWTVLVTQYLPIIGTGSPEGVVDARQYSLYLDSTGAAGAIEYRKMQTDIGGDTKKGWVLV